MASATFPRTTTTHSFPSTLTYIVPFAPKFTSDSMIACHPRLFAILNKHCVFVHGSYGTSTAPHCRTFQLPNFHRHTCCRLTPLAAMGASITVGFLVSGVSTNGTPQEPRPGWFRPIARPESYPARGLPGAQATEIPERIPRQHLRPKGKTARSNPSANLVGRHRVR